MMMPSTVPLPAPTDTRTRRVRRWSKYEDINHYHRVYRAKQKPLHDDEKIDLIDPTIIMNIAQAGTIRTHYLGDSPAHRLIETEHWLKIERIIRATIAILPKRQREVLIAHFYEGRDCAEIARASGTTRQAACNSLELALKVLEQRLRHHQSIY